MSVTKEWDIVQAYFKFDNIEEVDQFTLSTFKKAHGYVVVSGKGGNGIAISPLCGSCNEFTDNERDLIVSHAEQNEIAVEAAQEGCVAIVVWDQTRGEVLH